MAATVAFLNMKGGVGKTSLCFHLAGVLALNERRVLLVDNDPQASLTQAFLGSTETSKLPAGETVMAAYDRYAEPSGSWRLSAIDTVIRGICLVPGSIYLADHSSSDAKSRAPRTVLRDALKPFQGEYDDILIDCPPKIDSLTIRALWAADGLVIPVTADDLGVQGIAHVIGAMSGVRMSRGKPMLVGIAINKFQMRTKVENAFAELLYETYRDDVFSVKLPQSTVFPEAVLHGRPLSYHRASCPAADKLESFRLEYERRIAERVSITTQREMV